jgi:adenylate cyclase
VSTLPDFRRLFSSDVLRMGTSLKVGRVSLMFTDLTASTQLYRDMGDAGAFNIVQDHFELVGELVGEARGTIVKTMGDAVMAVFTAETDAIECASALHRAFRGFREGREEADACFLKIGVFTGPCYAVTANGVLDYFGQTVNVAARLQAQANGGEIVMTEEAWNEAGKPLLEGATVDTFQASLKGVGHVAAVRVQLDSPKG